MRITTLQKYLFYKCAKHFFICFGIICSAVFMMDIVANISDLQGRMATNEIIYFNFIRTVRVVSEVIPFIIMTSYVWLIISMVLSSELVVLQSCGLSMQKIFRPGAIFIILLSLFYLLGLHSAFIGVFNDVSRIEYDLSSIVKSYERSSIEFAPRVTIAKKNNDDITIIYFDNSYYTPNNNDRVYARGVDILLYKDGNVVWETNPDPLIIRGNGDTTLLFKKQEAGHRNNSINLNINFDFLLNSIDIERKTLFAFPLLDIFTKITDLKKKNLNHLVLEYQLYSTIKTVIEFWWVVLICRFIMCKTVLKRANRFLFGILTCLAITIVCFVTCYFLSAMSSGMQNGYLIFAFNILPSLLLCCLFEYLNLQRYEHAPKISKMV